MFGDCYVKIPCKTVPLQGSLYCCNTLIFICGDDRDDHDDRDDAGGKLPPR